LYGKKSETRFTIQFSRSDPKHIQVAEILNNQARYGKAQYIVDAVLHYESCTETCSMNRAAGVGVDEKAIEAVVNRILMDRSGHRADMPQAGGDASADQTENHQTSLMKLVSMIPSRLWGKRTQRSGCAGYVLEWRN